MLKTILSSVMLIAGILAAGHNAQATETLRTSSLEITSSSHSADLLRNLAAETQEILEAHRSFLSDQGFRTSSSPIKITLLASRDEFEAYKAKSPAKSESPRGFYVHQEKLIVTWETMDGNISSELHRILVHEALHHELHSALGDQIPVWLDEGLAVLFENAAPVAGMRLDVAGIHRAASSQVKLAVKQKNLLTLSQLMNMDRNTFYQGNTQKNYSQAWSFIHFLINDSVQKQKRTLAALLTAAQKGENLEAALTQHSGKSMSQLQDSWHAYLARM